MLLEHQHLLLNWFEAKGLSSGAVEGFNNKAKLAFKKPTDLVNLKQRKSRCIISLRDYRNQMLPTDSGEEAKFEVRNLNTGFLDDGCKNSNEFIGLSN